jgi:hypothetical protein
MGCVSRDGPSGCDVPPDGGSELLDAPDDIEIVIL